MCKPGKVLIELLPCASLDRRYQPIVRRRGSVCVIYPDHVQRRAGCTSSRSTKTAPGAGLSNGRSGFLLASVSSGNNRAAAVTVELYSPQRGNPWFKNSLLTALIVTGQRTDADSIIWLLLFLAGGDGGSECGEGWAVLHRRCRESSSRIDWRTKWIRTV